MSYQQPPDHRVDAAAGPPPGWYVDPNGLQVLRWWDGAKWGPHTQPLPGIRQESRPQHPEATGSVSGGYDAPRQKSAGRQRRNKILISVVLVVAALGVTSRIVYRSGHANSGCWMRSQDGTVVAQTQVGQTCTDTARLIIAPEDGGTYTNLSEPVSQPGSLICTATPPPGNPNSWKVWADPNTDAHEAIGLCQMLHNAQMTAAGTRAVALLEGSNGQDGTPPPSVTATPTATEAPTPATTTPAAAVTMSAADYQASYQEAYNMTAEDYRVGQTPATYHESYSQFCVTTIEASLDYPYTPAGTSGDPFHAGCMAALRAHQ